MDTPILDSRSFDDLWRQFTELARAYTPEWRVGTAEEDPGATLSILFCDMIEQSVDRMNVIPERLYTTFLNLLGFQLPAPVPATGVMQFQAHETIENPAPVPSDTQVFTTDTNGDRLVYETERAIEATPARLLDIYYVDSETDWIESFDLSQPRHFFTANGTNQQIHRFWFGQKDVLYLQCPCVVEVELRQDIPYLEEQTAAQLSKLQWLYWHENHWLPFDTVRAENGKLFLEKHNNLSIDPDGSGAPLICCTGKPESMLLLEGIRLRSSPLKRCEPDALFSDDLPILLAEGGYCFGKRPAPYSFFYIRSDTVLTKRGADVHLTLEISPIVTEPPALSLPYQYAQPIIDQTAAVAPQPDTIFIADVIWEYFNGLGWRRLEVFGNRNPFSCRQEGKIEIRFTVPDDIRHCDVNAETGVYIRVRVTEMANLYSTYARWTVPFLHELSFLWSYDTGKPAHQCGAENNGQTVQIQHAASVTDLHLVALQPLAPISHAMYFRFNRSPHAMPLSILFTIVGRTPQRNHLIWEFCVGDNQFESVSVIDLTNNLQHTGQLFLYLTAPLPSVTLFGQAGYWLRVRESNTAVASASPCVVDIQLNTVNARQTQRELDAYFDTAPYEANKQIVLPKTPVVSCDVWVNEAGALSDAEAQTFQQQDPENVRLVWQNDSLTHCWIRWKPIKHLTLAAPQERAYTLDPYTGAVRFGDGTYGRVPTSGFHTIAVRYASGGGTKGNVPAGTIHTLVGSLPRISGLTNITPMRGGTDRFSHDRIVSVGNKRLRHRGRAAGIHDFEELILEEFPQVQHVRCFSNRDEQGQAASGHVTIVIAGAEEGYEADMLCGRIFSFLSERCSCCLAVEGRLHIRPAMLLTVNVSVVVSLYELDQSAEIQRKLMERLRRQIEEVWQNKQIGRQIQLDDLWRVVRDTPGVRLVRGVQAEGIFYEKGQSRSIPLDRQTNAPYAVVRSGTHHIRITVE